MPRLQVINLETASGALLDIFSGVKKSTGGSIPNIFQGIANSPATLSVYLQSGKILSSGILSAIEREVIALTAVQN